MLVAPTRLHPDSANLIRARSSQVTFSVETTEKQVLCCHGQEPTEGFGHQIWTACEQLQPPTP